MWREREEQLLRRQALLRERSAVLRDGIARHAVVLERPLALADKARSRLPWLALPALLAAALRPRRTLGWALRAWSGWRLWRQVASFLR